MAQAYDCFPNTFNLTIETPSVIIDGVEVPCCRQIPNGSSTTLRRVYNSMMYWNSDVVFRYIVPCAGGGIETGPYGIQFHLMCTNLGHPDFATYGSAWRLIWCFNKWYRDGGDNSGDCLDCGIYNHLGYDDRFVAAYDWELISAECDPVLLYFNNLQDGEQGVYMNAGSIYRTGYCLPEDVNDLPVDPETGWSNCLYFDYYYCLLVAWITA